MGDTSMTENDTELSQAIVMQIKTEVSAYLIEQCAESFGVSTEKVSNEQIRNYCYAGMSRDEFTTVGRMRNNNHHYLINLYSIINPTESLHYHM